MNAEVIGEKIKNLREKNNISRENFANAVEISLLFLCTKTDSVFLVTKLS